jgi:GNAT superfamily N-acetyltransferase
LGDQVMADSPAPGVLAYRDGTPVGWCAVAPRASYPRLAHSTVSAATTDYDGLWALPCFVVPVGARRQGVASVLLAGAVDLARRHGADAVEAYPIDVTLRESVSSSELYHGPLSIFRKAGFEEVARPVPGRVVVRRTIR